MFCRVEGTLDVRNALADGENQKEFVLEQRYKGELVAPLTKLEIAGNALG